MPTIDLSTPPPPPTGLLDALPRRVALTLPELRLVAERAGGAPLPFDVVEPTGSDALEGRLGESRTSAEDSAYATAIASLHDPEATLERRGLVNGDGVADGLVGAVGLLATPTTAVDIDVAARGIRARSWHRQSGDAVATLSTVDGVVFELAWFPATQWPSELGRVGVLPEDLPVRASTVPPYVDVPFELADAAAEAARSGRSDLVPILAAQHTGDVVDADGVPLSELEINSVLRALSLESQGRLRVLVADVSGDATTVVGVVSWTLLADGWYALRPRNVEGADRVHIERVDPSDLATELAPVLAEVTT
jgi:hypothetical protein